MAPGIRTALATALFSMIPLNALPGQVIPPKPGYEALKEQWSRPVSIDAVKRSLAEVLADVKRQAKVKLTIDRDQLRAVGVDLGKATVSLQLHRVSLGQALSDTLSQHGLHAIARDGEFIVTRQADEPPLLVEVFDVSDIVPLTGVGPAVTADYTELKGLIVNHVVVDSWHDVGGEGRIRFAHGRMIVSQGFHGMTRVSDLLDGIRRVRKAGLASLAGPPKVAAMDLLLAETRDISQVLAKTVSLKLDNTSLVEFASMLHRKFKLSIILDPDSTARFHASRVNLDVSNVSLESAINQAVRSLGLRYIVEAEHLKIFQGTACSWADTTRVYPIFDLLGKVLDKPRSDGKQRAFDVHDLADLITHTIDPDTWDWAGGEGMIRWLSDWGMVIVAERRQHLKIEQLLAKLRRRLPVRDRAETSPRRPHPRDRLWTVVYEFATPKTELHPASAAATRQPTSRPRVAPRPPAPPAAIPKPARESLPNRDPFAPPTRITAEKKTVPPAAPQEPPNPFGPDTPLSRQPEESPAQTGVPPGQPADLGQPIDEEDLCHLIRKTIAGLERKGGVLQKAHGRLLVRQTETVHRKINELARQLRIKGFKPVSPIDAQFGEAGNGLGVPGGFGGPSFGGGGFF